MKQITVLLACVFAVSASARCPCTASTTLGLAGRDVAFLSSTQMAAYLDSLAACHRWRENLGVYVNYCAESAFVALETVPDSVLLRNQRALRDYFRSRCAEYLDDRADLPEEQIQDYWRGQDLPPASFRRPMPHQPLLWAGIGMAVLGYAALMPLSVDNWHDVFHYADGDPDWFGLDVLASYLGAILFAVVGIAEPLGGDALVILGSVKKAQGVRHDDLRRMLNVGVRPDGGVGVSWVVRW